MEPDQQGRLPTVAVRGLSGAPTGATGRNGIEGSTSVAGVSENGPMVRHVVLVKFKEQTTDAQRNEFIARSQWSLGADYVTGYVSGWPVEPNPYAASATEDWDWGMTLDFAEADVHRYKDDPRHKAVGADVGSYAERYAILDFIID